MAWVNWAHSQLIETKLLVQGDSLINIRAHIGRIVVGPGVLDTRRPRRRWWWWFGL